MATANLEVIIDGDSRRLTKSLKDAEDELKALQAQLKKATSGDEFDRLSKQINNLKTQIKGINTASAQGSLNKLGKSSVDASGDLINLGRVVQDAPFGFIGIANNINPLIDGFKRTATSAGGLKNGLKALGSSLAGAGGLSLLVSAVTTGFLLFGDELFGVGKAAKEANEAIDKLGQGVAEDLGKLTVLTGVIKNVNTATDDRKAALEAFNKEYKEYLKDLGIEEVTLKNINKAYDGVIDSMLRQAVVKGLQEEISKSIEKTASEIVKLQIEQEKYRLGLKGQRAELNKYKPVQANLEKELQQFNRTAQDGFIAQTGLTNATEAANDATAGLGGRINKLKGELKETLAPLLSLTSNFEDLGIKTGSASGKTGNFFDKTIARAKALSAFIEKNTLRIGNFTLDPEAPKPEQLKQALEFISKALNRTAGAGGGGLRLQAPVLTDLRTVRFLKTQDYFRSLADETAKLQADLQKEIAALTKRNPILIQADASFDKIKRNAEALKAALASGNFDSIAGVITTIRSIDAATTELNNNLFNTATTLNSLVTPAFGAMFQAITSGESPLKAFFKSIQQSIAQLIQRLIQAAIQALILRAILGPSAGSFGSLFKSFAGFRAEGGPVTAGKGYIVGEKGPEYFVPNKSGSIIPNGQGSPAGVETGGGISGGQFILRGRDLALVMGRQAGYNQRNV